MEVLKYNLKDNLKCSRCKQVIEVKYINCPLYIISACVTNKDPSAIIGKPAEKIKIKIKNRQQQQRPLPR